MTRAYTVKRLATDWGCSARTIYSLIDAGDLVAFSIGKRGLRISEDEVQRWQNANSRRTKTENSPLDSDGTNVETQRQLPTTAMRMVSVAGRD